MRDSHNRKVMDIRGIISLRHKQDEGKSGTRTAQRGSSEVRIEIFMTGTKNCAAYPWKLHSGLSMLITILTLQAVRLNLTIYCDVGSQYCGYAGG